ncbi:MULTISPECIES: ABC transporter permease [unclassified Clostridium]|uniref:ABC transporter permease n=1 Tax=unclassified Clostridium TaxID=2614128 RepID=UPI00189C004A|nr:MULTISPECIES: ABC transporter permease [unclassified Clostridium]
MSNLWSLFKTTFINSIGINKIFKEKSKGEKFRSILIVPTILITLIVFEVLAIEYSKLLADGLKSIGFIDLLLVMSFILSVVIIFFTSMYKAQGILFSARDYDLLMSLPIKSSTILINRMIQLLGINYLFLIVVFISPACIYFSRVEISYLFFIYLFIVFLLLPLIPVVVASIIAFVISYISSRMKHKNLIINSATLIFILLIMIASSKSGDLVQKIIVNSDSITLGISKLYPPTIYVVNALINLNFKDLLIFVALSVSIFSIFIFIFNKSFKKINSKLQESFKKSNYKINEMNVSSQIIALTKKEIKRYFSSPVYVLNTIIGPVLILIAAISTLFMGKEILFKIMEIEVVDSMIPLFIIAVICGILSISCTTNSSISMEGKNLWILKSTPIRTIDIFKGKIILNLILIMPTVLISDIIFFFSLKLSIIELIWLIIITTIYCFIVSILGIIVNNFFPNLNWTSETVVVKQSISVIIQMIISVIIIGVPILLFIKLEILNIALFITLVIIYLTLILTALLILLNTVSIKLFNKLN